MLTPPTLLYMGTACRPPMVFRRRVQLTRSLFRAGVFVWRLGALSTLGVSKSLRADPTKPVTPPSPPTFPVCFQFHIPHVEQRTIKYCMEEEERLS